MSNIYVTSDHHFNHSNIIKYCNRPFSDVNEMNEALINNWNSIVNDDDYVYCLGDFCLGNKEVVKTLTSQLKGHKILIKGNHDHGTNTGYREAGFETVVGEQMIVHFDEFDKTICFSHHPHPESEYLNLYGHVHDKPCDDETHTCVCVELWNYKPVLLKDLIK